MWERAAKHHDDPHSKARLPASRGRSGFTLVELLIVVVIIGILAAIAIPQFTSTKEKAYDSAAKNDLRNLMAAQEAYLVDNQTYASRSISTPGASADLDGDGTADVELSTGVSAAVTGDIDGYTGTVTHQSSDNVWCVDTHPGATAKGEIVQGSTCG